MTILGKTIAVDAIAVTTATMIGLALGTGYGLLLYRRWRTEVQADVDHHDAAHAAVTAVDTTGRAVLVGGTALIVALLLAPMIADTEILTSIGIGTLLCSALGVGAAVVVMPAFLVLAAQRTQALELRRPAPALRAWEALAARGGWVIRRAVPVGAAATALLAALALPLFALDTGPPSPKLLPSGDPARQSFERVAKVMGPGWPTPYNVVVVSRDRPITDASCSRRSTASRPRCRRTRASPRSRTGRVRRRPAGPERPAEVAEVVAEDAQGCQQGPGQAAERARPGW